jgi:dihydroxy-acid dehydratase
MDTLLLIIGLLLVATISAFLTGLITYPCGILVFSLFFIGRLIHLYDKRNSNA